MLRKAKENQVHFGSNDAILNKNSRKSNKKTSVISVILPILNHYPFLEERITSIVSQTHTNWECIVIDGFSTDGTWEYLENLAQKDTRFKLYQYPPNGPYDAWNKGIEKAKGKYIYIATSDDTMRPECLEKLSSALEANPICDIAHSCLELIDEQSQPFHIQWKDWPKATFYGDLIKRAHIRLAPHDGFVHAGWSTVYSSITQLLMRRSLFDKVGLFSTDLGPPADFEWGMRATMVGNTIHVPEYLATWRKHNKQLTQEGFLYDSKFYRLLNQMVERAYKQAYASVKLLSIPTALKDLQYIYRRQELQFALINEKNWITRVFIFIRFLFQFPGVAIDVAIYILTGKKKKKLDRTQYIRSLIDKYQLSGHVQPI